MFLNSPLVRLSLIDFNQKIILKISYSVLVVCFLTKALFWFSGPISDWISGSFPAEQRIQNIS